MPVVSKHPVRARLDKTKKQGKGGLVPDFEMQHEGCSKRKRSARDSAMPRSYRPTPEVEAAMKERRAELRVKAESMLN